MRLFCRLLFAFIAAIVAAAGVATVIWVIWHIQSGDFPWSEAADRSDQLAMIGNSFSMFLWLSTFFAVLFGLPASYAFWRSGSEGRFHYTLTGFSVVAFPFFLSGLINPESILQILDTTLMAITIGLPGAVCGYVWWKLGRLPHIRSSRGVDG